QRLRVHLSRLAPSGHHALLPRRSHTHGQDHGADRRGWSHRTTGAGDPPGDLRAAISAYAEDVHERAKISDLLECCTRAGRCSASPGSLKAMSPIINTSE